MRALRTQATAAAGQRLVIVLAGNEVLLITTRDRTFVTVPRGQVEIDEDRGAGAVQLTLAGEQVLTFQAVQARHCDFRSMTVNEVVRAFHRQTP